MTDWPNGIWEIQICHWWYCRLISQSPTDFLSSDLATNVLLRNVPAVAMLQLQNGDSWGELENWEGPNNKRKLRLFAETPLTRQREETKTQLMIDKLTEIMRIKIRNLKMNCNGEASLDTPQELFIDLFLQSCLSRYLNPNPISQSGPHVRPSSHGSPGRKGESERINNLQSSSGPALCELNKIIKTDSQTEWQTLA